MDKNQFSSWLSGFIDAEGNFQVFMDRGYLRLAFRILLHIDDVETLHKIKHFLGVGTVSTSKNIAVYRIYKTEDLLNVLIPLLDNHSLRTTKWLDYSDFKSIVLQLSASSSTLAQGTRAQNDEQKAEALKRISGMNQGRKVYDYSVLPSGPLNPYWLLGFIEGDGTFGIKSMSPYFQVGQHIRNDIVLDAIVEYLLVMPKGFNFSLNTEPIKTGSLTNKKTDVRVISVNSVDTLHDYLAYFLLDLPFQTRKKVDFLYWCIALYLHKFGHFYTPEGRKLFVSIANYINHRRYSSVPGKTADLPAIDSDFLTSKSSLPITLLPDMTHLELAQSYGRLVADRKVYVYDNNVLVSGSPFSSYPLALEAIGESNKSSAIKRNIDTGRVFKSRYTFYSTLK